MGRRSETVLKHTVRVGRANKSEFKVACRYCRAHGQETQFVSRTDAVNRHLKVCQYYDGDIPTITYTPRHEFDHQQDQLQDGDDHTIDEKQAAVVVGEGSGGGDSAIKLPMKRSFDNISKPNNAWVTNMERQILRTFVSTGMPFSTVQDKRFRELLETVSPQLKTFPDIIPTGEDMNRIWKEADQSLKNDINKEITVCKTVTMIVDTWMNTAEQNTLAFVVRTPSSKLLAWEWDNVDTDTTKKDVATVVNQPELQNKVISVVVTRAAACYIDPGIQLPGNCLLLSCYDQELMFMVGDCLSGVQDMKMTINTANKVVSFFRDKTRLKILNEIQSQNNLPKRYFLGPINTEWIVSRSSLELLLDHRQAIEQTLGFIGSGNISEVDSAETAAVANELRLAMDENFWQVLNVAFKLINAMAEYKIKANEESGARLRMILPAALSIWKALQECDIPNTGSIIKLLNHRLRTWDMDLLILATVLDVRIGQTIFDRDLITPEYLDPVFESLYQRLNDDATDIKALSTSFYHYLRRDRFPFDQKKFNDRSLISFYWPTLVSSDHPQLSKLAMWIESCVVSAVDSDKLFSDMGCIHSALRSNKTVVVDGGDDTTDPAFRDSSKHIKDQRDLCALLDICLQETTYNQLTARNKHNNEFTFETLFNHAEPRANANANAGSSNSHPPPPPPPPPELDPPVYPHHPGGPAPEDIEPELFHHHGGS